MIDGHITTSQTSIMIETKINTLENVDKLVKYASSFHRNELCSLVHLSTETYGAQRITHIKGLLNKQHGDKKIHFYSLCYEDLVSQLNDLLKEQPVVPKLERLVSRFEAYCLNMGLLFSRRNVLRAMACGQSIDLNERHRFYFDQASRGFSPFTYFGIYGNESVQYICTVEAEVVADWSPKQGLIIKDGQTLTKGQAIRLSDAIRESVEGGWPLAKDHRFFLFDKFVETDFRKTSPGGIFHVKYSTWKTFWARFPRPSKELQRN